VRHANVYGIDMPSKNELIASFRNEEEIGHEIGADALIYQSLDDLKAAVGSLNPVIKEFETSCFDGIYVTGDITAEYLDEIEGDRAESNKAEADDGEGSQLDLNLVS
jgi:amidophosphoribosyltransferase